MTMNSVILKNTHALLGRLNLSITLTLLLASFFSYSQGQVSKSDKKDLHPTVQIKTTASDEFLLFADYYPGDLRSGGVIILHDCQSSRSSYRNMARSLANKGLHTLLVDLRSYGDSISQAYSEEVVKTKATDIVSYQSEMEAIKAYWPADLLGIHQYLSEKIGKNEGISIVANGCSVPYAVSLLEKRQLESMVMISPKMTYSDKDRYKNLIDIPNYFITSAADQDSFETTQELFTWNGDKGSKMQIFKGTAASNQLISRKKDLVNDIALWLGYNLR